MCMYTIFTLANHLSELLVSRNKIFEISFREFFEQQFNK